MHLDVMYKIFIAILLFFGSACCAANSTAIKQTKNKLEQLDGKINKLKQMLASAKDKRGLLNKELAKTEKQMSEDIRKLRIIQKDMANKEKKIHDLQGRVNLLNKQLQEQQHLLAAHVQIRYKMGEYQPIKWLLNQDDPTSISRLLTFHQYLVQKRQYLINQIDTTKKNLTADKLILKKELKAQQTLQQALHTHQRQLKKNNHYNTTVLNSLNNEIHTKQHILVDFERNKKNLAQLLKTLAIQSQIQTKKPFTQMRHKLPRPVAAAKQALQKMNQGVTFFAAEGTPVTAVYPGKVVFSDWLNGYGLLLIIDHGQGFMTLYAHNLSLFKHKGSTVLQGEQIAAVGHSGGIKQNGLYFEVRHRGKAISPFEWLS